MSLLLADWPLLGAASESVPVTVDAQRKVRDGPDGEPYEVIRAVYLIAEIPAGMPVTVRRFWTRGPIVPALLIGGAAIITGPASNSAIFRDAQDVGETFDAIEADGSIVEIGDIWLPVRWMTEVGETTRGTVVRVGVHAFTQAYRSRVIGQPVADLMELSVRVSEIAPSSVETAAFRDWSELQIEEAKAQYPKDERLKLAWTATTD